MKLDHYPALLTLKAACLAAVAANRDAVLLRLLREPSWRDATWPTSAPALDVLFDCRVLLGDVVNIFPSWGGNRWVYPASHLLKEELRLVILPLIGDEDSYIELYHRTEYRTALVQWLAQNKGLQSGPSYGEYIGDQQWRYNESGPVWEYDFRQHADRGAWGWAEVAQGEPDPFDEQVAQLGQKLAAARRF